MRNLASVKDVKMTIVKTPPPNALAVERVFPGVTSGARPIIFAYGKIIYNPNGFDIPLELLAHEAVHSLQQEEIGVDAWWAEYLANKTFRYNQEVEAHRVEYEQYCALNTRAFRRRYIKSCAERLSGPLYGNVVGKNEARRIITAADREDYDDPIAQRA